MNWNKKIYQRLIQAVLLLETKAEARRFLRDLLTVKEIDEFAKRLQTAELLAKKTPYTQIEALTGFSSTTVARVSKWLNGHLGGYRTIISKLHHHPSTETERGLS